jgi:hypothetical protein
MSDLHRFAALRIRGIGAWAGGMPDWTSMRAVARGEMQPDESAPKRPAPALLPPNERRRAPDSVLLALQVAQAACDAAGADPATTHSIFASMHGDLAITDTTCRTLAESPADVSPIRFHNSVHNAASGYWTIGCGSHAPSTAISAFRATFAQGLIEAATQLATDVDRVLLVAYDSSATGPLAAVSSSEGLLGFALVLERAAPGESGLTLSLSTDVGEFSEGGALTQFSGNNAMAPALAFIDALANERAHCVLDAGPDLALVAQWPAR